jgi:acylphosphatase
MDITTIHLIISGRVQGVGYRNWMAKTAQSMGLTGWVRNLPDGRVEAVASGEAEDIERLITQCHKGPLMAKVTDIQSVPHEMLEKSSFDIIR